MLIKNLKKMKILNSMGFKKYFKNTSWMVLEQAIRMVSSLLIGIWIARYLGAENYGIYSYVIAFSAIFTVISKLGLDSVIVKEIVNKLEKTDIYLSTCFWIKLKSSIILIIIIACTLYLTEQEAEIKIYIMIISFSMIFQSFDTIEYYFQAKTLAKYISISKIIQITISSSIKIYLVMNNYELFYFVLIFLFDNITLSVLYLYSFKVNKKKLKYNIFNLKIAKELLKESWPLIFSSFFAMIYLRIDQLMIMEFLGGKELGLYSAAVRLSESLYFIPILLTTSLFPAIINSKNVSQKLYKKRLQDLYILLVWIAIPLSIFFNYYSEEIINLTFGSDYLKSHQVLLIHVWSSIFIFLSAAFGRFLIIEKLAYLNMLRVFFGAIINVILNYLLIPQYGIEGAAYSTFISLFLINIVFDMLDKRLWEQLKMKVMAIIYPIQLFYTIINGKK